MKKTSLLALTTLALFSASTGIAQNITGSSSLNSVLRFTNTSSTAPTVGTGLLYDNGTNWAGIGGTGTLGGELFGIQRNSVGYTSQRISNSTAGGAVNYIATTNTGGGAIAMSGYSSGYAASGIYQNGAAVLSGSGATMNVGTTTSTPLTFWINNAQQMVLNTSGQLGINTPSPAYPLDVNGNIHIPTYSSFLAGTTTGSTPTYLSAGFDGAHSAISSIGTALLLNYSTTTAQDVAVCNGPAGGYLMTGKNVEIGGPGRDGTTALNLRTNGTTTALKITNSSNANVFNIDNAGNTSISATANIYFNGIGDSNHGLGVYTTNLNSATFGGKTINGPVLYGYSGGALGSTAGGQKVALQWNNTGQVYIGGKNTTYASALLHVNGDVVVGNNAGTAAIHLYQSNWADFVFDANYKLMPLNEVENFYQTNHHLPNVPTTKEIQTQGNDLGQTDAVLLQKIEELTLYMVKQQKQLETQQQLIETLANKLADKK